jgi:hypothetical protein
LEVLEGLKKLPEDIPWTLSLKGKRAKEFDPGLPNVFIIDGEYDNLREIYQSHDLYVSGSKGEGWDLIAWEALACGVPTIVPAHSGYLEWGHLAQGWLTSFHMEPSLVKVFGDSGEWYVQDPEEIAKQVESLWQSYNESADEAYQNARQISREWTWQHAAAQLVLGLWEHGFDMTPLTESTDKQEYTPLVSIRATNSLIEGCDVGGYRLAPILEGVTYRVPGEVARVLQVAGYAELVA